MRTVDKVIECHNLFHFLPFVYFLSALGRPIWAAFVLYGSDCVISKYCDRCHKKLKVGEKCGCTHKIGHKVCKSDDFYYTPEWHRAREECIRLCCGLDLYSLSQGKIEFGYTVHHIEPINKRPDLRLTQSNLIYLTESNHKLIHSMYETGMYQEVTELLRYLKERFVSSQNSE